MLAFASVLWTHDVGLCIRRLIVLGLTLVGMMGLARNCNLRELCWVAVLIPLTTVVLGVGCELALGAFRPWSGEYRFSGTVHPNTQGVYLATMCLAALCLSISEARHRYWLWAVVVIGVVLLILTKSRTSTIGTLAVLGGVCILFASNRTRLAIGFSGVFVAAAGVLMLLMFASDADALLGKIVFLGREEEADSFSGRTTIWPVVQRYIDERFWFGYGFESFWNAESIEAVSAECGWGVRESHSAYRDMLLSLGAVGLTLYLAIVVLGIAAAAWEYRARRDACALFWVGMAVNGLFNAMFESGMTIVSFPTFMIAAGLARLAFFQACAVTVRTADRPRRNPDTFDLAYGVST
jgi:exopolysaccharide production protein ExoQ